MFDQLPKQIYATPRQVPNHGVAEVAQIDLVAIRQAANALFGVRWGV